MSEAPSPITTRQDGGVLTITFNRPDKKNALTVAMYQLAVRAIREANNDKSVRALVLTGAGGSFTAGNDLADFMNVPPAGLDSPVIQFLLSLVELEKPILCAVQGPAIGIGTTLLLHCDLVYADETAKFRLPFVDLGLVPEGASSFLLPRIMGAPRASELLYFSEVFDARKAKELGLITDVIPADRLATEVQTRAATLAQKPPASLRATKKLLRAGTREQVMRALKEEGDIFVERLRSEEAMEAFSAFFEKRKPDFSRFS
ncbi:MAG: enoyl-CoA hydratase [Myxococcota bacterium]